LSNDYLDFWGSAPSIHGIQRAAAFHIDDYLFMKNYFDSINWYKWIGEENYAFKLSSEFNVYLRRHFNDHHNANLYGKQAFDIDIHHNIITAQGIVGMVAQLANQTNKSFTYGSMGFSSVPETIGQKTLIDEKIRVSVLVDGSIIARGNVLNHLINFGYGPISGKYYEFGIHDSDQEPSRMLARAVLKSGVDHTQNKSFVTGSHSTIFSPKSSRNV
jgi:hypothetical protein